MSITVSTGLAAVLDGIVQEVGVRVSLALPVTGLDFSTVFTDPVRSLSLSAQNGTDLPDEVRDVVGFTALGGQLVMAGPIGPLRKETMAWLLNPDETGSPLYRTAIKGTRVTIDFGYRVRGVAGLQWVRKFTGSVASYSLEHDEGTATLNIVDRSVDYDSTPDIPGVAVAAPYNSGLTSQYAMDAIIRAPGGDSSWPARRTGCVLAAGLRSSLWPEVGALDITDAQPLPKFAAQDWGAGLASYNMGATTSDQITYKLTRSLTDGCTVQMVVQGVDVGTVGVTLGGPLAVVSGRLRPTGVRTLTVTPTGVTATYATGTGTLAYTFEPGPHVVTFAAHYISFAAGDVTVVGWSGTVYVDGVNIGSLAATVPGGSASTITTCSVTALTGGATIAGLQVTSEDDTAVAVPFTPAAVLDTSLNPLTVVPEIPAGSKGSDELQTIAAAELGYARFDEQGVFRFTNRQSIANAALARTITADTSLRTGLSTDIGAATQYDTVQVPFTTWIIGAPAAIYTLDAVKSIPPHSTLAWLQPLAGLAVLVDTSTVLLPDGHDPNDGGSYYRASSDPNGLTAHPGLDVQIVPVSAGTVRVTILNHYGQTAYLTTPATYTDFAAGSLSSGLWVGGTPVTPSDEALTSSSYGPAVHPPLAVSSNAYLQVQKAAQDVGDYLLPQLVVAIRDFTGVAIIPDPRLQIPDRVRLLDPYRAHVDEYAQIWGWQFSAEFPAPGASGGSWDMTLDLRALAPPGGWIGGLAGRSEGASTTYSYA